MTRSTNRLTDRSASERMFTNHCSIKTGAELKQLMHRPQAEVDPYIRVRKSSIVSLKSWAEHRQHEDWHALEGADAEFKNAFWLGFIRSINEILDMEAS